MNGNDGENMKTCLIIAVLALMSLSEQAFAKEAQKVIRKPSSESAVELTGKLAADIADKMNWGDCGAGHCGSEGKIFCRYRNEAHPKDVTCTITPENVME
jgi:uncharacterized low-complexity protein